MEDTLATLVAMPTISDDLTANKLAVNYLAEWFGSRGMHIKHYEFKGHPAFVATVKPNAMHAKVMLYGHTDVMSGTERVFTMRHEGERLTGRGVYDMKFAIATYMHVIDEIKNHIEDYDFSLVIVSDEEYGSRDDINSMRDLLALGYRADVCIMPDGGFDWNIEAMCKGFWRFDLISSGKAAHASRPWEGESASFKLIQALHELRSQFKGHGPDTDTLNIGTIHGDGTYNQIPAEMTAAIEIRLVSDDSYTKNKALIKQLCKKYGLKTRQRAYAPPFYQNINHPLVQAFFASAEKGIGRRPQPCISNGASDTEYLLEAGIPCVLTYPPGGGHHSEHEWIERTALPQFYATIRDYLDRTARIV